MLGFARIAIDGLLDHEPRRAWLSSRFEEGAASEQGELTGAQPLRLATYKGTREDLDAIKWLCAFSCSAKRLDVRAVKHKQGC
jgi:hypothetical protein